MKRSSRNGPPWIVWAAIFCGAGFVAWLWWSQRTATPDTLPLPFKSTGQQAATVPDASSALPPTDASRMIGPTQSPAPSPHLLVSTNPLPSLNAPSTSNLLLSIPDVSAAPPRTNRAPSPSIVAPSALRSPRTLLELQLALVRLGISPGSLDGVVGAQTRSAILAFQESRNLRATGEMDAPTQAALAIQDPIFTTLQIQAADLEMLTPIPGTWLGKSHEARLNFETPLELAAEKGFSHPRLVKALNPTIDWTNYVADTGIVIPNIQYPKRPAKAAFIRIRLAARTLQAFDQRTNLLAHFPCSIARLVEKRPAGMLFIEKIAEHPNYRFDPAVFPESVEARTITRPLMISPGPNNPVGTAWIGLNRSGYGIHGTPNPEAVGRTESHGCFRLANWNADYLLQLVTLGTPVLVEP